MKTRVKWIIVRILNCLLCILTGRKRIADEKD